MRFLKTNTATRITVGPFLDVTDAKTPEVALTATNEKLTLMVDDGGVPTLVLDTTATASGGANDFVHVTGDDAGYYDLELAAANVNYLGRATLAITYVTDHLPVFHEFMILSANAYDMLFGSTLLPVNATQISGDSTAADNAEAFFDGTGYAGTNNVIPTVTTLTNLPAITANWLTAAGMDVTAGAEIADAVWDEAMGAHNGAGSAGLYLANTLADTDELQTDWVNGGRLDLILDATATGTAVADVPTVAEFEARTLPAADYVVVGDTLAAVTTVGSVTGAVGSVTGAVGSVTGNVGGNVVGSVGSVTGAVGSVTGAVGSVTGAVGSVTAGVTLANDAVSAAALSAAAIDEILDEQIGDGTITMRQALRVILAGMAGKLSGAATTSVTIRNLADSADVVVATVDADGNRSAVTVTP